MVIRGKKRGNGKQLASYLLNQGENEEVIVFDIRGTAHPLDVHKSLLEMSLTSELTKSKHGLYHAQISPEPQESLTMNRDQWLRMRDIHAEELGFSDAKCVMVMHRKNGHLHMHVAYERYDHDSGIMISDSFSRYAQDRARKRIEKELNLTRTPDRNQNRETIRKDLTELWHGTSTGKELVSKAEEMGYTIARSDQRREFVVIDRKGRSFDLVREIKGARKKDIKARLKGEKLREDKDVIKGIRNQKELDKKQDIFSEKISAHKAKEEMKIVYQVKLNDAKKEGYEMTVNTGDPKINKSQGGMNEQIQSFRNKKIAKEEDLKEQKNELTLTPEQLKEKYLNEIKEIRKRNKLKNKDKGDELGL